MIYQTHCLQILQKCMMCQTHRLQVLIQIQLIAIISVKLVTFTTFCGPLLHALLCDNAGTIKWPVAVHLCCPSVWLRCRLLIKAWPDRWRATPDRWRATPDRWRATPDRWRATPDRWRATPDRWRATPDRWRATPTSLKLPYQEGYSKHIVITAALALWEPVPLYHHIIMLHLCYNSTPLHTSLL